MSDYYRLGANNQPVPCSFDEYISGRVILADRRVRETTLPDGKWVSTVFLGRNHQYGEGPPLLFETMVFPAHEVMSELDMDRYSTWDEAVAGHEALVKKWTATDQGDPK